MTNILYFEKPRLGSQGGPLELSPGVILDKIQPGGRKGPNGEVQWPTLGGQVWTDSWVLGGETEEFQLRVPDVRMPANQYYPLHYHGCWIAVIILDGTALIGDWWMKPGDVLVAEAGLEYGPVLNGPEGCQLFEIFAQDRLGLGGYAKEYHDHPTLMLQEIPSEFKERTGANRRNEGNQVLPNADVPGLYTGRLEPGEVWNLGRQTDPNRGAFKLTVLESGQTKKAHTYDDWHATFILEGGLSIGNHRLMANDVIVVKPGAIVPDIKVAAAGLRVLEVARTIQGLEPRQA